MTKLTQSANHGNVIDLHFRAVELRQRVIERGARTLSGGLTKIASSLEALEVALRDAHVSGEDPAAVAAIAETLHRFTEALDCFTGLLEEKLAERAGT